ncbi:MAG: ABC transporter, partial [Flavobacteriaceae bacterium CG_4_10_14_3_um_filter_33_47]
MKELQHLNKYFLKYKWHLLIGVVITIIARIFLLFTPRYVREIFTVVEAFKDGTYIGNKTIQSELIEIILFIVGAAIIAGLLTFLMRQTIINVSRYIEYDLKNEVYEHYQKLSLNFYKKNRTGDLM